MATSEERMKILQMIQDGKISAEDGAKLLSAISENAKSQKSSGSFRIRESRILRIRVTDITTGKTKVSVNLPLGLVDAGLNIASNFIPSMGADAADDVRSAINEGLTGKIIDVMDEDGEHVEIYIE